MKKVPGKMGVGGCKSGDQKTVVPPTKRVAGQSGGGKATEKQGNMGGKKKGY